MASEFPEILLPGEVLHLASGTPSYGHHQVLPQRTSKSLCHAFAL